MNAKNPVITRNLWDNRSGSAGAGNTIRTLTRSLDETKEGLLWSLPENAPQIAPTALNAASNSRRKTATFATANKGSAPTAKTADPSDAGNSTMNKKQQNASSSRASSATSADSPKLQPAMALSGCSIRTTITVPANGAGCSAPDAITPSGYSATTPNSCSAPLSISRILLVSCSLMTRRQKRGRSGGSSSNAVTPPAARDLITIGTESLVAA